MEPGGERPGSDKHQGRPAHNDSAAGMMAMMMSMCLGVVLLFAVIPAVGLPLGLAIAAAGAAIMLFVHGKVMRHGGH